MESSYYRCKFSHWRGRNRWEGIFAYSAKDAAWEFAREHSKEYDDRDTDVLEVQVKDESGSFVFPIERHIEEWFKVEWE